MWSERWTDIVCSAKTCDVPDYLLCDSTTHAPVYDVTASSSWENNDENYGASLSCLDNQAAGGNLGKNCCLVYMHMQKLQYVA